MRKLFTSFATMAMAAVLTLSAGAVNPTAKASRNQASKLPAVEKKQDARGSRSVFMETKATKAARLGYDSPFGMAKPMMGNAIKQAAKSQRKAPAYVLGGADVIGCCVYPQALLGMRTMPEFDLLSEDAADVTLNAGCFYDGKYIGTYVYQSFFGKFFIYSEYDAETWELLYQDAEAETPEGMALALAVDPKTDVIYGVFYNEQGTGLEFGTFDPATHGRASTICEMGDDRYMSLSFDKEGNLYGITVSGNLCAINKATGEGTLLSATGLATDYLTSGTIVNGVYYYATSTDDGEWLYGIDMTTYAVEDLGSLEGEVTCMTTIPAAAEAGAPAAAENVEVVFTEGQLNGQVSFTAPTTTFDGEALTGSLAYTVTANGDVVAEGTVEAGADVTADVTVAEAGEYTFVVTLSNAAGESPKAKVTLWIGPDAPAAPANVVLVEEANGLALSWDAVTTSVHNGYFDEAAVVYTVSRVVDEEATVVAENLQATSFVDNYAGSGALETVSYRVVASFNGVEGPAGVSNSVVLGSIIPPYENGFDTAASLDGFTIIDANEDGKAWTYVNNSGDGALRMSYNSSMDMDDYAVLPPVQLESGKTYEFSFDARAQSATYPERVEVILATGTSLSDLQNGAVILEPTDLTAAEYVNLSANITVAEAGKYYLAIHGISDADQFYLYVDNVAVSAPFSGDAPGVVTDVVAVPATDGSASADITFKAPAVAVDGQALTSLDKVEVTRDGELVKVFDNPTPGATLSFNDVADADGTYTYSFVAYNAAGAGKPVSVAVYLGVELAAAPINCSVMEWVSTPGKVTISWEPVLEDINGNAINGDLITYIILDKNQDVVAMDIPSTETEFTCDAVAEGEQEFVYFFIVPVTNKGANTNAGGYGMTDMIACGTPYEMPVVDSFDGGLSYIWGVSGQGSSLAGKINLSTSCSNPAATPFDGDGGMLSWWPYSGDVCEFFSGKITVAEAEGVAFSFYYHTTPGYENAYELMPIVKIGGQTYDLLDEPVSTTGDESEWLQCIASLVDYCGMSVQVGFRATCNIDNPYMLVDLLEAKVFCSYDLAVTSVTAPRSIDAGAEGLIKATIKNEGMMEAGAYTVDLLCNGEKAESISFDGLAPNETQEAYFAIAGDVFSDPEYTYQVKVVYAEDENLDNNESENIIVRVNQSMLPAVEDLEAVEEEGTVKLTWSAPDTSSRVEQMVDGAEDYESFAIDQAGDWTFVDVDQSSTYGFQGIEFPGNYSPMSFIVFDAANVGYDFDGITYSGDKVFACFAAENAPNDDWMISPELPGIAQTVSFQARSWTVQYGNEQFEFYYSTTSPAISDMVKLDAVNDVPEAWTEYSYELPEGAKYFAIRCVSNDRFIFLVDDITFSRGTAELNLVSYDVYRDQECIESDVEATEFVDTKPLGVGEHVYFVVANYTVGQSALSNPAIVTTYPATLNVIGEIEGGSWNPGNVAPLQYLGDGVFEGVVNFTGNWFSLCEKQGVTGDWNSIGLRWGAVSDGYELAADEPAMIVLGNNDFAFHVVGVEAPFTATVSVDFKTNTITLKNTVGIESINAADSDAIYYNIQGVRVNNPANGFYIQQKNGQATKVYVK